MEKASSAFTATHKAKIGAMSEDAKAQQDRIHRDVGCLIASWANTESAFLAIAERLIGSDEIAATISYFSLSSNYARMSYLRALGIQRLSSDKYDALKKLIDRFKSPTAVRNEFAHAEYVIDMTSMMYVETSSIVTTELTSRPMRINRPFDKNRINEIKQAISNLGQLNSDLWTFYNEL